MKYGDRIVYCSKRPYRCEKQGNFIGRVRHTRRYKGPKLALVVFDGNKKVSLVHLDKLRRTTIT